MNLLSGASMVGASVLGAVVSPLTSALTHARVYSTAQNKVMMDAILRRMPADAAKGVSCGPWAYVNQAWTPFSMCSLCPASYCASLDVHASEYDPSEQSYTVHVYRPCCLDWGVFERHMSCVLHTDVQRSSGDLLGDDLDRIPTEMLHLVRTCAQLAYPGWTAEPRSLLPPDLSPGDAELAPAISLARRIVRQELLPNGSGVFLLRGPPMTGKSTAAKLVAAMLGPGTLVCEEYSPTTPGHLLNRLVEIRNQHDRDAHLVIILEEVTWLTKILRGVLHESQKAQVQTQTQTQTHHNKQHHQKLMVEVDDKDSWSSFPEKAVKCPKVVVIMTSNMDDALSDEFDAEGAMLRQDRITAEFKASASSFDRVFRRNPHDMNGSTKGSKGKGKGIGISQVDDDEKDDERCSAPIPEVMTMSSIHPS